MNPYIHVILDDPEWSLYFDEKETLFFPYFPFYIEGIRKHEGKYDIVTIKQDENCKMFSQNFQEMKNYWNKLIKKELEKENHVRLGEDVIQPVLERFEQIEENQGGQGEFENDIFEKTIEQAIKEEVKEGVPIRKKEFYIY